MLNGQTCILLAGLLGASGVALGAYQAHGLEKALAARGLDDDTVAGHLDNCGTAVQYQMYHALALLGLGTLMITRSSPLLSAAGVCLLVGTLLFSGGIYLHVFMDRILHWAIIPTGGVVWIVGWVLLAVGAVVGGKPEATAGM